MLTMVLSTLFASTISLPGGPPVGMDFLTYDRETNRVWVPAGNTGNVDVVDVVTGKVTAIGGFVTAPARRSGRPRMGPARPPSVKVSFGSETGATINSPGTTLRRWLPRESSSCRPCRTALLTPKTTHELWATTPADKTITITRVDGKTPGPLATIKLEGAPEGYAVDDAKDSFYTNLEDKDRTLVIDIKTRKVLSNWPAGCGSKGPRGLALDTAHRWLFVACTNGMETLDLEHGGKLLGRITTGDGVDNPEYDARKRLLFIASGADGEIVIAHVDDKGVPQKIVSIPTAKGARNPVIDVHGNAYVEDSSNGRLLVIEPDAHTLAPAGSAH